MDGLTFFPSDTLGDLDPSSWFNKQNLDQFDHNFSELPFMPLDMTNENDVLREAKENHFSRFEVVSVDLDSLNDKKLAKA